MEFLKDKLKKIAHKNYKRIEILLGKNIERYVDSKLKITFFTYS